jgi:hypothetical protein
MPLEGLSVPPPLPGPCVPGPMEYAQMAGTRRPRDQLFTKNDVTRAFKAAQAAGVPNPRVEIDRTGKITIISGETPPADIDDLDAWLARREKDARPA